MTIGTVLGAGPDSTNYVDDVVAQARLAADAGLESGWFAQIFHYDAIALAAVVGTRVPELRLGTSAVPIYGRHPLPLAAAAQTAQAATHNRFTFGIALGAKDFVEPVFGVKHERPALRLREYLTVFDTLFKTGTVDFAGETVVARTPFPAALPGAEPPSVVVAVMGPKAVRVAGELSDGIQPYLANPKALETIVADLRAGSGGADRRVIALVPIVVTDDVEGARERAAADLALYETVPSYQRVLGLGAVERAADLAVIGDEKTVADQVRRYFEAGATEVVAANTNLGGPGDQERTWRLLGSLRD
ncbi:TIGR03564 family F420-dependent LLM class oxidoreductase [Saccharothrix violaceirubra]|uniref:F420-dependent oxidoreductase-like protein n=1 Tax=Saccharothrix violaceirubra TaxID=413306 RepID=A0A7W7WVH6_9PSEU|nr:TIGR03564 family F420-dependent LLM class oxidoreductase [Saccharothrix violaceirubra]MBB4965071.1 F420-dependent oxidoreductase-like protein [Saccharothrix violaceirubra]